MAVDKREAQERVFVSIVSQLEHGGVQGWSLSLNFKGDGDHAAQGG